MTEGRGLECFWSDLTKHPACSHGPTLLFGKYVDGALQQFYACSACRDSKTCNFYAEKNDTVSKAQKKIWAEEAKKSVPSYNHRKLFLRHTELMGLAPSQRAYCQDCNKFVFFGERQKHSGHVLRTDLTDEEMNNPTMILKPLSNVKKEAQYLFSKKSTVDITNFLLKSNAEQVLCIGAPRIHEHITQNFGHKMSSLLLDFDGRFHNFFGPLNYCWYNLFNHHFFTEEGAETFRDFLTQNGGKNTFLICDPPFGGRVEPISQTIKKIADQHKEWNNIVDEASELKIFFVFPYFMESIMRQKSNPAGITGGLKDLQMTDYKVDYDNHPLFMTGSSGRKHGSPVRIFTNIGLNLFELPAEDGYRYCKRCDRWVAAENKHCKVCKACTSKDGRRYRHCKICGRCVKPTWKHCEACARCTLEKHRCGEKPKITGCCFQCGATDHVSKDCGKTINDSEESVPVSAKKRKTKMNEAPVETKKQKVTLKESSRENGVGPVKLKKSISDIPTSKVEKLPDAKIDKIATKKLKANGVRTKKQKMAKQKSSIGDTVGKTKKSKANLAKRTPKSPPERKNIEASAVENNTKKPLKKKKRKTIEQP